MNKNTIIIAAYNKPDLLHLYLEQLYSDPTIAEYQIQINTEVGYDAEQDHVLSLYKKKNPEVEIKQFIKPNHTSCPLAGYHNILSS